MNPMTNVKNVTKLSALELQSGSKSSWHDQYKDSAWIFVGGLPYELTEGDVISVFSQYGEIVNINLIRDKGTGKFKGFGFICYEDQRSTILSVDNFNGIKILGRTIRVDHVENYRVPKDSDKLDEATRQLYLEGCAPKSRTTAVQEDDVVEVPVSEPEIQVDLTKTKKEKRGRDSSAVLSSDSDQDRPSIKKKKSKKHSRLSDSDVDKKQKTNKKSSSSAKEDSKRKTKMGSSSVTSSDVESRPISAKEDYKTSRRQSPSVNFSDCEKKHLSSHDNYSRKSGGFRNLSPVMNSANGETEKKHYYAHKDYHRRERTSRKRSHSPSSSDGEQRRLNQERYRRHSYRDSRPHGREHRNRERR